MSIIPVQVTVIRFVTSTTISSIVTILACDFLRKLVSVMNQQVDPRALQVHNGLLEQVKLPLRNAHTTELDGSQIFLDLLIHRYYYLISSGRGRFVWQNLHHIHDDPRRTQSLTLSFTTSVPVP